jgi:hypothetical protein
MKAIILAKGGSREKAILVDKIQIPDLWHVAHRSEFPKDRKVILEVWHLCHDLLRAVKEAKD